MDDSGDGVLTEDEMSLALQRFRPPLFLHPPQNHSRGGGDLLCCTEDATSHGPACASIPPKLRLGRGRRSSIVPATSKWPLRKKSRRKGFLKRGENHTYFLWKFSVWRGVLSPWHELCKGEGMVTYEDFIDGILRCKGPARAIDQTLSSKEKTGAIGKIHLQ